MIGPMDILANINKPYIQMLSGDAPPNFFQVPTPELIATAPTITFHHIGPTMDPVSSSGGIRFVPTATIADCPKLDYLLIGGPAPNYFLDVPEDMKKFIVERSKEVKAMFTTCTGGMVLAATGLLNNLPATANHFCIPPFGEKFFSEVKWDTSKHWVVVKPDDEDIKKEGVLPNCEFWTAAGAGAGMDMMASWIRGEFGEALLGYSTCLLEWRPSDVMGKPLAYFNGRGQMQAA